MAVCAGGAAASSHGGAGTGGEGRPSAAVAASAPRTPFIGASPSRMQWSHGVLLPHRQMATSACFPIADGVPRRPGGLERVPAGVGLPSVVGLARLCRVEPHFLAVAGVRRQAGPRRQPAGRRHATSPAQKRRRRSRFRPGEGVCVCKRRELASAWAEGVRENPKARVETPGRPCAGRPQRRLAGRSDR